VAAGMAVTPGGRTVRRVGGGSRWPPDNLARRGPQDQQQHRRKRGEIITTYKVEVEREGKWWMIRVPDIDGLTQARRINEIEEIARSLIAASTDSPLDEVAVEIVTIRMESSRFRELLDTARDIRHRRARVQGLEREVNRDPQQFAFCLTTEGIPIREVAGLLGIARTPRQSPRQQLNCRPGPAHGANGALRSPR
jgi:hypothetical protein